MDIRAITDDYAVSPQIEVADVAEAAAKGFRVLICNRPDDEVGPDQDMTAMRAAAEAAGMTFVDNPFTSGAMTMEHIVAQQNALSAAEGPTLAYCRTGTRCASIWALAQAGQMPTDQIMAAAAAAGYDLGGLRGLIDQLASGRG